MNTSNTFLSLLRQRCPVCRIGQVFCNRFDVNRCCPSCGFKFEREPGYFLGAMYFSYALAAAGMSILMFAGWLLFPSLDLGVLALICIGLFIPFVPATFRYSRVLWLYFDHWASPPTFPASTKEKPR